MHGDEAQVSWWGVIPFAMLLACIAILPLLPATRRLWHRQSFQLLVALSFGLPMAALMWWLGDHAAVVHALVEYAQFIALLLSLFVISGGIFVAGDLQATPRTNLAFLAVGGVLASFIGTTGAAMALIRPILNVNRQRKHRVHTVVFAIFVIANCGGLLTPLGDPPLFLGMLRGVPFLWTLTLFPAWLFVNGLLLLSYYVLDRRMHAQEPAPALIRDALERSPLRIRGRLNLLWLLGVVLAVALAPSVDLAAIHAGHAPLTAYLPLRELLMLSLATVSFVTGSRQVRFVDNEFTWAPILEVAALFSGIFLAMVPALAYLRQVAPTLPLNEYTFFFFTGGLSAVLDNAPTYVTFFEMARSLGGSPAVAGVRELHLVSISLGAVFCGAITYIGNGPNFMVKSIADAAGVPMPSFGGYVLWTLRYLIPVLLLMVLVIISPHLIVKLVGFALTVIYVGFLLSRRPAPLPRVAAA